MKTFVGQIVTVSDGASWSVTVSNGGWRIHQGTNLSACFYLYVSLSPRGGTFL
jgi:hypothetical protein